MYEKVIGVISETDLMLRQAKTAEHGKPVRLTFRREETSACSQTVLLDAFDRHADLPEGTLVPVEFVPAEPGEYPRPGGAQQPTGPNDGAVRSRTRTERPMPRPARRSHDGGEAIQRRGQDRGPRVLRGRPRGLKTPTDRTSQ
ncbi:hypothetical protein SMIR_41055 (plasmid) [Streptomyces mirabilis]|uniref:hypothetical protein n=1 Tax=Streptomyces mirabilis TaxID=68239 RepID=UPI001BAECAB3|nr:hypothetical protein [Streptomyces mirabilis]QUW85469.1 hypothetical protein SMIR_41055 [Streptomyces mirabilis]